MRSTNTFSEAQVIGAIFLGIYLRSTEVMLVNPLIPSGKCAGQCQRAARMQTEKWQKWSCRASSHWLCSSVFEIQQGTDDRSYDN